MEYPIFISHAYRHRRIYFELVQRLNDVDGRTFSWRNVSVQYDMRYAPHRSLAQLREDADDEWLRDEISQRINSCDVLLALTKPVATRRRWLQWEIGLASELGKPILGIARKRNDPVSAFVRRHAVDIVDTWRTEHIVNAIKLYGNEYRKRQRCEPPSTLPPPLPAEIPDEAIAAVPSPVSPEEAADQQTAMPGLLRRILPRDLLFRDARDLAGGPAFPTPAPGIAFPPRWWRKADK